MARSLAKPRGQAIASSPRAPLNPPFRCGLSALSFAQARGLGYRAIKYKPSMVGINRIYPVHQVIIHPGQHHPLVRKTVYITRYLKLLSERNPGNECKQESKSEGPHPSNK
jgi:hypothetical protein